jgi:hypothetical protein
MNTVSYTDILERFSRLLFEAEGDGNGQEAKKETELERYYRVVEDLITQHFSFPGFSLDESMRMDPDARLAGGRNPPPGGYRIAEYLMQYLSDLLMHPHESGGLGIGDSRPAYELVRGLGDGTATRGAGSSGDALTPQSLRSPDTYPDKLKQYVAMLTNRYLIGMLRVAFEECGLMSYVIYNKADIRKAIIRYSDEISSDEDISERVQPDWDFDRLHNFAHVVMPQFVLKALVAPSIPTPNCDSRLIAQNAAYLGNDLRTIQAFVVPVEDGFDVNLQAKGSAAPATYNELARYAAAWNFSVDKIKEKASHDVNGQLNVYTPPDGADAPDVLADDGSLRPRYVTEQAENGSHDSDDNPPAREYPSESFGDWTVVDIDNDTAHCANNHNRLMNGYAYTYLDGPDGPFRFWFRGGAAPRNNKYDGVYAWCWMWDHYDGYRKLKAGDRGYMLLSRRVLDRDVLAYRTDGSRSPDNNGNIYDSSAFGIVIAGPHTDIGIPGLVKPNCFQGRNDVTSFDNLPGARDAVHYDPSMVPNGGDIPGLIKFGNWPYDYGGPKKHTAAAINNSIFALALIGKWDSSIRVSNGSSDPDSIEFYTDQLVELMQKWFPVDLGSGSTAALGYERKITLLSIGDLSTLGRILGHAAGHLDFMENELRLTVFKTDDGNVWHVLDIESSGGKVTGFILVPADDEFRLRKQKSSGEIDDDEYDERIGALPATMYTLEENGRFIPFLARQLTVSEARELLSMWNSGNERPLAERIGRGDVTARPDAPEDSGNAQDQIVWAPAMKSAGKRRNIGCTTDGGIWVRGPETDGEPRMVATDTVLEGVMRGGMLRGTYVVTGSGEFNIWITSGGSADGSEMYIGYVRKGKCRTFRVYGSVLGYSTTNAILMSTDGKMVSLGNLMGDIARLNRQNSDRYTLFVDMSELDAHGFGTVVDGAGLYGDVLADLGERFTGNVALGVVNGRAFTGNEGDSNRVVGTLDWYSSDTLEYVSSTDITLDMVVKNTGTVKLPREIQV